jgi:hypothetical protein
MRTALQLEDGVLPLYPNPHGSYLVSEDGEAILHVKSDPMFVPLFELLGSVKEIREALHTRLRCLEKQAYGYPFTYIIVRTNSPGYCTLGLVRTKTEIEGVPLARSAWMNGDCLEGL